MDLFRVGWRGRFSSDKIYTCYLVQLVSFCGIFNFTRCIVQKLGLAVINLRGLLFLWNLYWVTLLSFWFYDLEVSISDLLFRWGKPSFWSVFNISLDWWDFSAFFLYQLFLLIVLVVCFVIRARFCVHAVLWLWFTNNIEGLVHAINLEILLTSILLPGIVIFDYFVDCLLGHHYFHDQYHKPSSFLFVVTLRRVFCFVTPPHPILWKTEV